MPSKLIQKYMREEHLPHIWCPGCSHGSFMRAVAVAVDRLGLDHDKVVFVSGIGCSSRSAGYMDFNTIHTTHGRAFAFATGIKMANPELEVILFTGDGDASAIGGNHLIHACRRNIGITTLVMNNNIYGMTGGQYSPTTPTGEFGTTAPYGNIDRDFDIVELAKAAGATFTARANTYDLNQAINLIQKAIEHKGFSLVDCLSICPSYYGRKNKKGDAVKMIQWQKEHTVSVQKAQNMTEEELQDKIVCGVLCDYDYPEYTEKYQQIIDRVRKD